MLFSDLEITGLGGNNCVFLLVLFWVSLFSILNLEISLEKRETQLYLALNEITFEVLKLFVWIVIQGLYLSFWLVVIEIFLPLCIWLTCLILSAFVVVVVVTIISLRD